ncbi:MAG: ppic-type ppiase domain protein [Phycisphaerales bacterium]|nr:ppic-type ppiase domain protein [Phycisphaerales bacterium]MDB5356232.1 ppic-type ppiase domain protein [Phycisphaerales bacterium]
MSKRVVGVASMVLAGAAMAGLGGCGIQPAPILSPEAFVQNRPVIGDGVGQPVDRPGALVYDAEHNRQHLASEGERVSRRVQESVKGPEAAVAPGANGSDFPPPEPVAPATQPAQEALAPGQYQLVGSVLAVVNGQPIYANKVVNTLDRALAAEARKGDAAHFKQVAADLIARQINEFMSAELEFADAQTSLDRKDEQIARMATNRERNELITAAGGSEAMARQRAADEGVDFDEMMQQKFRTNMVRLYYQKKVLPLIQISASDMRQYYQANLSQFQKPAKAQFRVIKINPTASGGHDKAANKIADLYKRVKEGEDFADLAGRVNDDPVLMKRKGAVGDDKGWMEKGAYAVEKVDEAVWQMHPGEISPPIDGRDPISGQNNLYLVKVDALEGGVTEPFESERVQSAIKDTLWHTQFNKLHDKHRQRLLDSAVKTVDQNAVEIALQMVMQKYPQWVAAR